MRPARADAGAHGRQGPAGDRRGEVGDRQWPVGLHRPHQQGQGRGEDDDDRHQDARLADPVEEAALDHGEGAVGDHVRRGHRAGQRVGARGRRDQQHDAEADHGDRQPSDEAGRAEQGGCRDWLQDPAVGRNMTSLRVGPPARRQSRPIGQSLHRRQTRCTGPPPTRAPTWRMAPDVAPYDALLLVSFGGPEGPEDVVPFLENVTRGRGIPRERLEEVGQHYHLFGGRSPINDQNRELLAALREDLAGAGIDIPSTGATGTGTRFLTETVRQMAKRRRHPGGLLRDQRLLVVLRLPAVPREPGGRGDRRRGRAPARPAPSVLQPPRLHRARRGRDADGALRAARSACARPPT